MKKKKIHLFTLFSMKQFNFFFNFFFVSFTFFPFNFLFVSWTKHILKHAHQYFSFSFQLFFSCKRKSTRFYLCHWLWNCLGLQPISTSSSIPFGHHSSDIVCCFLKCQTLRYLMQFPQCHFQPGYHYLHLPCNL